jgi:hypothetical protein
MAGTGATEGEVRMVATASLDDVMVGHITERAS